MGDHTTRDAVGKYRCSINKPALRLSLYIGIVKWLPVVGRPKLWQHRYNRHLKILSNQISFTRVMTLSLGIGIPPLILCIDYSLHQSHTRTLGPPHVWKNLPWEREIRVLERMVPNRAKNKRCLAGVVIIYWRKSIASGLFKSSQLITRVKYPPPSPLVIQKPIHSWNTLFWKPRRMALTFDETPTPLDYSSQHWDLPFS